MAAGTIRQGGTYTVVTALPSQAEAKKLAKWQRSLLVAEDGEVYVPAVATGFSEQMVGMCWCWDGVSMWQESGHLYVPLSWVRREYPKLEDLWSLMEKNARRGVAQEKGKNR
jgi:hypothetical protein